MERNTYRIPEGVSYHDAALIEPLACVLKGFEETAPRPGDTIAILGLGPIGLMFVRLANLYGCRVIAIGRRRTQLERAEAMGAHELVRADQHVEYRGGRAQSHRRPRRRHRRGSRGQAGDLALGAGYGAARRHCSTSSAAARTTAA